PPAKEPSPAGAPPVAPWARGKECGVPGRARPGPRRLELGLPGPHLLLGWVDVRGREGTQGARVALRGPPEGGQKGEARCHDPPRATAGADDPHGE
ncbi:unnamed protein product, partial [Gulo gulo]